MDYILAPVVPEILRAKVSVFVDLYRKTAQIKRQADERAKRIRAEAARAEAEAARERSAFLAEASNILASSFDPEETFAAMARHTVPRLADYCLFDVVDENGALRTLAAAHRDESVRSSGCANLRNRLLSGARFLAAGSTRIRARPRCANVSIRQEQDLCDDVNDALAELEHPFLHPHATSGSRSHVGDPLRGQHGGTHVR